jgi:uncharacterized delta-60 repeat protein
MDNVAVAVVGTRGSSSAAGMLTLSVTSPHFSLAVTPPTIGIGKGSSGSVTVTVTRQDFAGAIAISVSGLPAGVTADSLSIAGNRGTLVLRVGTSAQLGPSSLTVVGVSGSSSAMAPLALQVLQPGGLDVSFGVAGVVLTPFDSSSGGTSSVLRAVAMQPDGKIVVAGNRTRSTQPLCGPTMNQNCVGVAVARYNPDGTLDSTFAGPPVSDPPPRGVAIVLETDPAHAINANGVAVSDGGILVAVSVNVTGPSDTLLRFTSDGVLDPSFNPDGGTPPGRARFTIAAKGVAAGADEAILVGGQTASAPIAFALARYDSDGTLDATFGDGGILSRPFTGITGSPSANAATFGAEKAKVVGSATFNGRSGVAVMSFGITDAGSIDESFNGTGQALIQLGSVTSTGAAVLDMDAATVVVATTRDSANHADVALERYDADGGLDPTFGTGGIARTLFSPDAGNALVNAAATFAGKIVLGGTVSGGGSTNNRFLVLRYNSDGSLDTSFGGDGSGIIINVPNVFGSNGFNGVTFQNDGKIVAVGQVTQSGKSQPTVVRYVP